MKTGCYEPGEIGRLADLAADDPACRHFATCVRCRGLLASYRSFMAAGERPARVRASGCGIGRPSEGVGGPRARPGPGG